MTPATYMTIWINDGEPIESPIDKAHPKRSAIRWSLGRHGRRAAVGEIHCSLVRDLVTRFVTKLP